MRARSRLLGLVLLVLALGGCASAGALVEALAKDPNSACVTVNTPYGSVGVARAAPGAKLVVSGGSCTVESVSK